MTWFDSPLPDSLLRGECISTDRTGGQEKNYGAVVVIQAVGQGDGDTVA